MFTQLPFRWVRHSLSSQDEAGAHTRLGKRAQVIICLYTPKQQILVGIIQRSKTRNLIILFYEYRRFESYYQPCVDMAERSKANELTNDACPLFFCYNLYLDLLLRASDRKNHKTCACLKERETA